MTTVVSVTATSPCSPPHPLHRRPDRRSEQRRRDPPTSPRPGRRRARRHDRSRPRSGRRGHESELGAALGAQVTVAAVHRSQGEGDQAHASPSIAAVAAGPVGQRTCRSGGSCSTNGESRPAVGVEPRRLEGPPRSSATARSSISSIVRRFTTPNSSDRRSPLASVAAPAVPGHAASRIRAQRDRRAEVRRRLGARRSRRAVAGAIVPARGFVQPGRAASAQVRIIQIVPNCVSPIRRIGSPREQASSTSFPAGFKYQPNLDGAEWFLTECCRKSADRRTLRSRPGGLLPRRIRGDGREPAPPRPAGSGHDPALRAGHRPDRPAARRLRHVG